jgi:DNA-binding FadR family transcriptional regulator
VASVLTANDDYVGQLVRAPKTAELISNYLRTRIVRGELKPGEKLPSEAKLMEQFGVSRPTLREAFRILETEALISVRRGSRGGAEVITPDVSVAARYVGLLLQMAGTTVADVYEARVVVEPSCARKLAQRRTKQDLADLEAAVEDLQAIVDAGRDEVPDPAAWARATYRFHELVLDRAGNKTLAIQAGVLHEIVATHLSISVARDFQRPETMDLFRKTVRSYRKLISLLEARDGDGAEKHWRAQMEAAGRELLRDDLKNKRVVDLFT